MSELEYAFLGSVIVGNGVNFGIILLARYVEERRLGSRGSLARGRDLGLAQRTVVAALAAATAYGSLMLTQFRGFHQFGVIGAVGMVACWAMAFLLSRPCRVVGSRWPAAARAGAHRPLIMGRVANLVQRYPGPSWPSRDFDAIFDLSSASHRWLVESNMIFSVRRADSHISGEAYGPSHGRLLGLPDSLPCSVISPEAASAVTPDLKPPPGAACARLCCPSVQDKSDVIPQQQPEKLAKFGKFALFFTRGSRPSCLGTAPRMSNRTLPEDSYTCSSRAASAHVDCGAARAKRPYGSLGAGLSQAERRHLAR